MTDSPTFSSLVELHITYDPRRGPRHPGDLHPTSVIECLADVLEMGLQAEAGDFWKAMDHRRRKTIAGQTEAAE